MVARAGARGGGADVARALARHALRVRGGQAGESLLTTWLREGFTPRRYSNSFLTLLLTQSF